MDPPQAPRLPCRTVGRYEIYGVMASGGMATVHYGRLTGPAGFSRPVAIKQMHAHYATNPEFAAMFLDEAQLASRVRHPNVVSLLDLVTTPDDIFLILEYVHGDSLSSLLRRSAERGIPVPIRIAATVVCSALYGLHAAHEAKDALGRSLQIVHRDVSPQNILVGTDGVARVLDFGVAKAAYRLRATGEGEVKGKVSYMAPEQLNGDDVDRRSDVFSAAIVLWEALTGKRMADGSNPGTSVVKILLGEIEPPSHHRPDVPVELDEVVVRALQKNPADRYQTARDMTVALEAAVGVAAASEIGAWVEMLAGQTIGPRAQVFEEIESQLSRGGDHRHTVEVDRLTAIGRPEDETLTDLDGPPVPAGIDMVAGSRRNRRWKLGAVLLTLALGAVVAVVLASKKPQTLSAAIRQDAGATGTEEPTEHAAPTERAAPTRPGTWAPTIASVPLASSTGSVPTARPAARTSARPRLDCKPPYVIDDRGHKIWKRHCL